MESTRHWIKRETAGMADIYWILGGVILINPFLAGWEEVKGEK